MSCGRAALRVVGMRNGILSPVPRSVRNCTFPIALVTLAMVAPLGRLRPGPGLGRPLLGPLPVLRERGPAVLRSRAVRQFRRGPRHRRLQRRRRRRPRDRNSLRQRPRRIRTGERRNARSSATASWDPGSRPGSRTPFLRGIPGPARKTISDPRWQRETSTATATTISRSASPATMSSTTAKVHIFYGSPAGIQVRGGAQLLGILSCSRKRLRQRPGGGKLQWRHLR